MPELLMMKGLPGSGKSFYAKEMVLAGEGKWKRVNKDSLRLLLDEGKWSREREKSIIYIRNAIVETLLVNDINVIVDDTNFSPAHEQSLRNIAKNVNADFHIKFIDTNLELCLKRNRQKPQPEQVPDRVIIEMYKKHIPKPSWQSGSIDCIIVDVDGTVADFTGLRSPYAAEECDKDKPISWVISVVEAYSKTGATIVFLSGRHGTSVIRNKTRAWLNKYISLPSVGSLSPYELFLRKEGDNRPDWIVKQELFMNHINGKYNPIFVIDDRPQVCRMWRYTLGLSVLQVNDIEF